MQILPIIAVAVCVIIGGSSAKTIIPDAKSLAAHKNSRSELLFLVLVLVLVPILPHIQSCIDFCGWLCWRSFKKNNLISLHRRAAKLMLHIPNMSTEENIINILPIEKQFTFNKAIIVYKTLHNQTPNYTQALFYQDIILKSYYLPSQE